MEYLSVLLPMICYFSIFCPIRLLFSQVTPLRQSPRQSFSTTMWVVHIIFMVYARNNLHDRHWEVCAGIMLFSAPNRETISGHKSFSPPQIVDRISFVSSYKGNLH